MCTGLVQLLHLQPERLGPHMQSIIEYMLESTQVRSCAWGTSNHGNVQTYTGVGDGLRSKEGLPDARAERLCLDCAILLEEQSNASILRQDFAGDKRGTCFAERR